MVCNNNQNYSIEKFVHSEPYRGSEVAVGFDADKLLARIEKKILKKAASETDRKIQEKSLEVNAAFDKQNKKHEDEKSAKDNEINELKTRLTNLTDDKKKIDDEKKKAEDDIKSLKDEVESLANFVKELTEEKDELKEQISESKDLNLSTRVDRDLEQLKQARIQQQYKLGSSVVDLSVAVGLAASTVIAGAALTPFFAPIGAPMLVTAVPTLTAEAIKLAIFDHEWRGMKNLKCIHIEQQDLENHMFPNIILTGNQRKIVFDIISQNESTRTNNVESRIKNTELGAASQKIKDYAMNLVIQSIKTNLQPKLTT